MIEDDAVLLDPSLEDVLAEVLDTWQRNIFTALPGVVESFDSAKQTATVSIPVKDVLPERTFPVIPSVPVWFPRAGGMVMTVPVEAGDTGLLIFTTLNMDLWRATGQVAAPSDPQRHAPTSAVFFPGLATKSQVIPGFDTGGVFLGSPTGLADYVALAQKVQTEFSTLKTALITAFNAVGASTAANGANGAASLSSGYTPGSVAASDVKVT